MIPIYTDFRDIKCQLNRVSQLFHNHGDAGLDISTRLQEMMLAVIKDGDDAVIRYTRQFDRVDVHDFQLQVSQDEIRDAYHHVSNSYIDALKRAQSNIEAFHQHQKPQDIDHSSDGVEYGMRYTPLDSVGLYVPGGRAQYPSSVLMNAIPAQIAGVPNIVMVTPPNTSGLISPEVLVTADLCGVHTIIKSGGAQSVFALANGTKVIPKVYKIVGPGNIYVTKAKQMVYGLVDIDKPAGPSEVLVVVNHIDYAHYAAAELLAQLEHDPLASAIAVSTERSVLEGVQAAINQQLPSLKRQAVLKDSINNCTLYHASNRGDLINVINNIASEHLVLLMEDYSDLFKQVKNAGSIFCGPYTPVTLGDYYAGPNHVLPTDRAARYASPLGVMDFMKFSSYLSYSKEQLSASATDLKRLTEAESFDAHYQAVHVRLKDSPS